MTSEFGEVAGELAQTVGAGALAAVVSEPARARGQMLEEWAASAACEQKSCM